MYCCLPRYLSVLSKRTNSFHSSGCELLRIHNKPLIPPCHISREVCAPNGTLLNVMHAWTVLLEHSDRSSPERHFLYISPFKSRNGKANYTATKQVISCLGQQLYPDEKLLVLICCVWKPLAVESSGLHSTRIFTALANQTCIKTMAFVSSCLVVYAPKRCSTEHHPES